MAGEGKSLKIGVKYDDKGMKSIQTSLKSVEKSSEDLNKSITKLNTGFTNLGKGFDNIFKGLKDFKKEIGDLGKDIEKQNVSIKAYTQNITALNRALTRYGKVSGRSSAGNNQGGANATTGVPPTTPLGIPQLGMSAQMPLFVQVVGGGGVGGSGNGPGGGGVGGGGNIIPGPAGTASIAPNTKLTPSQVSAIYAGQFLNKAGSFISSAASTYQQFKTLPMTNLASVQGFHGDMMRRLAGGDFYDMAVLNRSRGEAASAVAGAGGTGALGFQALGNAIQGGGQGLVSGKGLAGGLYGMGSSVTDYFKMKASGGDKVIEANNFKTALEAGRGMNPFQGMMFGQLAETAGIRLSTSRRTGGRQGSAFGVGGGYGLDMGEAGSFFSGLSNKFGASAVMGNRVAIDSEPSPVINNKPIKPYNGPDAVAGLLGNYGYNAPPPSMKEYLAKMDPIAANGGKKRYSGFKGIGQSALDLETYGFDRDLMGSALGNISMGIGGDKANSGEQANKKLEEILRKAFANGLKDVSLTENIVQAISNSAIGPGGALSNVEQLGFAYAGGLNKNSSMLDVQSGISGLSEIGSMTNANPLLNAVRYERAKRSLGGNQDQILTMALANASPEELIGGSKELDTLFSTAGIGKEESQKIRKEGLDSIFEPAFSMLTSGNTALGRKLREGAEKAGGMRNFFKDAKNRDLYAPYLRQSGLVGSQESGAEGLRVYAYADDQAANPNAPIGAKTGDGLALAQKRSTANIQNQIMAEQYKPENLKAFMDAFKSGIEGFKQLKEIEPGFDAATEAIAALEQLVKTIQNDPQTVAKIKNLDNRFKGKP